MVVADLVNAFLVLCCIILIWYHLSAIPPLADIYVGSICFAIGAAFS